jgi:hypothetical protein
MQGRGREEPGDRGVAASDQGVGSRGEVPPAANPRTAAHLPVVTPFTRDCGYTGPPDGWDEERRFQLRCELAATSFRLYLASDDEWARDRPPALREKLPTPRHAIEHIMDSFPIVKRKDEEACGRYRTKEAIADSLKRKANLFSNNQR